MKYDAAIIGGGISGLTIAYKLSKKGKKVIVIEKEKRIGGMLRSIKKNNYLIEEFYHHILPGQDQTVELIKEIGLENKLIWRDASTGFYYNSKFYTLTVPFDLLKFSLLSFSEKMRLGFFLLRLKLIKNPEELDTLPAQEFIIKKSGKNVYEKFFKPLLSAKYGKNLHRISTSWFIDRINIRNKRGYKGEVLGYVEGGFGELVKKLIQEIKKNNGEIIHEEVNKIEFAGEKIDYLRAGNQKIEAENFISTIPGPALARLGNLPQDYKEKLSSLENQGAICILIGLKKKLTDFYWTNIINEDISFRALIEHTNFQPVSNYGEHIVYLASYPENESELWKTGDKEIFEKYFKDLKKVTDIKEEDVNWYEVIKEKNAGLIYNLGILNRILPVKTPVDNLYLAGMLNSHPDRNLEQSIKLANKVVGEILS